MLKYMTKKTKRHEVILATIPLLLITAGCLISEDPFYEENDLVEDDRLIGTYGEQTNRPSWYVEKQIAFNGHYTVTYVDASSPRCHMTFDGALFQIGTNRFLDLVPTLEACDHVGGAASPIEYFQGITLQPLHLLLRISPATNSIQFRIVSEEGRRAALAAAPEMWDTRRPPHLAKMLPNTSKQRQFLARFGSDTNIFSHVSTLYRVKVSER